MARDEANDRHVRRRIGVQSTHESTLTLTLCTAMQLTSCARHHCVPAQSDGTERQSYYSIIHRRTMHTLQDITFAARVALAFAARAALAPTAFAAAFAPQDIMQVPGQPIAAGVLCTGRPTGSGKRRATRRYSTQHGGIPSKGFATGSLTMRNSSGNFPSIRSRSRDQLKRQAEVSANHGLSSITSAENDPSASRRNPRSITAFA